MSLLGKYTHFKYKHFAESQETNRGILSASVAASASSFWAGWVNDRQLKSLHTDSEFEDK